MNIKKFLTVLVLGLAVFAVSCSKDDDDNTTTTPTTPSIPTADVDTFMGLVDAALAAANGNSGIAVTSGTVKYVASFSDGVGTSESISGGTELQTGAIKSSMQSAIDGITAGEVPSTIDLSSCTVVDNNSDATISGGNTYTFTLNIEPADSDSYKAVTKTLSITITA